MTQVLRIPLHSSLRGIVRRARGAPFDVAELLGMAAALVLAAALAGGSWLALPLGAVLTVPFIVRRARRGEGAELP